MSQQQHSIGPKTAKKLAKSLTTVLDHQGVQLPHRKALDVIAELESDADWHRYLAREQKEGDVTINFKNIEPDASRTKGRIRHLDGTVFEFELLDLISRLDEEAVRLLSKHDFEWGWTKNALREMYRDAGGIEKVNEFDSRFPDGVWPEFEFNFYYFRELIRSQEVDRLVHGGNENCLQDMVCPQCGQDSWLNIYGAMWFDDGSEEAQDFDHDDHARCPDCGFEEVARAFFGVDPNVFRRNQANKAAMGLKNLLETDDIIDKLLGLERLSNVLAELA